MVMRIVQYNIQSLNKNINNLDIFLNDNKVDFCALSETWSLGDGSHRNLCNYKYVEKARDDGYGGVARLTS